MIRTLVACIALLVPTLGCQGDEAQTVEGSEDTSTSLLDAVADSAAPEDVPEDTPLETTEEIANPDIQAETDGPPPEVVELVETTVELIDNGAWVLAPGDEDPWYGDGSKATNELCEPDSYQLEFTPDGEWFEVDTSFCAYLTVRQGLPVDLPEGANLAVQLDHEVISEGTGPYTLGIGLGSPGKSVWEVQVSVPSLENEIDGSWVTDQAYAAGDPVLFHISNHGANNWALRSLTATFMAPVEP